MISLKWMILTPLQKLPNILGDLGKIIVANSFERLPKVQKIAQSGHTVGSSFYRKCGQIVKLRPKRSLNVYWADVICNYGNTILFCQSHKQ